MSGAAQRAAFAAVGGDLVAGPGGPGQRRAAGLVSQADEPPPTAFAALLDAPGWLRWPRETQVRLAQLVALRSMAPALANSIDGAWLGAFAGAVGEEAVDWAIHAGADASDSATIVQPDDLTARGFAILRAGLPPALRGYLVWAPRGEPATAAPVIVEQAVAFVGEPAS